MFSNASGQLPCLTQHHAFHIHTEDTIDSGNNGVERMNRKFVAIRDDDGGNRSSEGMDASSILFTVFATCKVLNTRGGVHNQPYFKEKYGRQPQGLYGLVANFRH